LLLGELSMDKRNGFFSTRKVYMYMVSHGSNKTTGSTLIVAHWRIGFLALCACYKLLTWHYSMAHVILLDITQSRAMCILVWPG
jgi:hypothetical protein